MNASASPEFASTNLELSPLVTAEIDASAPGAGSTASRFVSAFYLSAGASVRFKAARRAPGARYRWSLNGSPIEKATDPVLALLNLGTTSAGTYSVTVDQFGESTTLDVATLTVVSDARLTHFTIRSQNGLPDQNLVVGFYIAGAGSKRTLLRSIGSSQLQLAGWDGKPLASNPDDPSRLDLAEVLPQLTGWSQPSSAEDALRVESLETGGYSALVTGAKHARGSSHLDLYDTDAVSAPSTFANVSGRARLAGSASKLTVEFKIEGAASATVLIRGIGPGLRDSFGMPDALTHTQLILRNPDGRPLRSNCRWGGSAALAKAFSQAGAFALLPTSEDSAILATLPAGAYTAELSGRDGASGVGLIEVYSVPSQ